MDEPTLTRVMTAMATTLGTALSNQANTERAAQAASTAQLAWDIQQHQRAIGAFEAER